MSKLGVVEDTLFVPLAGRIYASERCPRVLYDGKALSLKGALPAGLLAWDRQSQYTLLASTSRSANMDRSVRDFLRRKPDGIVAQLGCGLETAYFRCDNGKTRWYAVDLPHVIEYRRELLPEPERESYLAGDAFSEDWLRQIRAEHPDAPLLVTAGGLLHHFEERRVLGLLGVVGRFGDVELVFDAVNERGMAMLRKKYMKQVGHAGAPMFFYVDSAAELTAKAGGAAEVLAEEPYYRHIPRRGLKLSTRVSMWVSDRLRMVKMVRLGLGERRETFTGR